MRASRFGAIVVAAVALAGCAPTALPPGLSDAEVEAIQAREAREWWAVLAPDEPMPTVAVVDYETDGGPNLVVECVSEIDVAGVEVRDDGSVSFDDAETMNRYEREIFLCSQAYPYRGDGTAESMGLYSRAQLDVLLRYFSERLIPCLEAQGFVVAPPPAELPEPYVSWSPYYNMGPQPSNEQWRLIDLRCPPAPFGEFLRPGQW